MHIKTVQETSVKRAIRWHGSLAEWSTLEWCGAMAGEAGEAANVAKKLRRHDQEIYNGHQTDFNVLNREALREKLRQELADVFLYLVLCAAREEIDLESAIVEYFNKKSEEAGFPERL